MIPAGRHLDELIIVRFNANLLFLGVYRNVYILPLYYVLRAGKCLTHASSAILEYALM